MNKKFSTLAVAAMLASAFTVNAAPGDVVTKLAEGDNGKQYQLVTKVTGFEQALVLTKEDNGVTYLRLAAPTVADLASSLWCVNVTLENQGKNPIFDFTNKGKKAILDVTIGGYDDWTGGVNPNEAFVGGEVAGWEFVPVLGTDKKPMFGYEGKYSVTETDINYYSLRSYINSNEVATLVYDKIEKNIHVAVYDADESIPDGVEELTFVLKEADCVTLSPEQFNTILYTRSKEDFVKLTFDKNYNNTDIVNPFSENELMAQVAEASDAPTTAGFVNLYRQNEDGSKQYLRVDTAYANDYGVNFLKFAFSKNNEDIKESNIPYQYNFRLNYLPTTDELFIQAEEARYLKDGETWWHQGKDKPLKGDEFIKLVKWDDVEEGATVIDDANCEYPHNWVKLQDLVKEQEIRIITLGDKLINTHISFGFGGCSDVKAEYTSVADGVYVIKNAKGQVLASPIYKNGSEALFVSVDEQDPEHMPAYQWVVLTNYTQEKSLPTSPVTITNREFPKLQASMQLREKNGAKYMFALTTEATDGHIGVELNGDSLKFERVADVYVKDKYLGYKKISKDSLTVNKYTFNYWHPYAADKFIAKSSKDSTLTVLEGKDAVVIDTVDYKLTDGERATVDIAYGFTSKSYKNLSMNDVRKRIPGLAQLVRTVYEMKDGGINEKDATIWKVNANEQFNLGANNYNTVNFGQKGYNYYVFFKENNHIDGKHYYALVKAEKDNPKFTESKYIIGNYKAGVSDYDAAATLKNQVLAETRTSSFYIAPDETPLYRRFNSTLEGQAGDGVDTLRFYEKYRNEYLMIEANPSFMVDHIDFLGIDAQDKAKGGLAFIVDTAWVNRGAGHIKPQYLISIDRNDYQGVAGEPCTEAGPHIDESGHITEDPMECVHAHKAVPGFKRGKFLINFHHFANNDDMVGNDDYKWAEYDRAGFKEAIIVKDTMYILRDEFKNLKNEEINLAKIASAEVEAKKAYSKKNGDLDGFLNYRYELTGDKHKYVTWSMRFFDRSVAANEVEADRAFLFESMKSLTDAANTIHDDKAHFGGKYSPNSSTGDIAPDYAAWLKMQNGCLVLSDQNSKFNEVVTGADDALIFNVEHVCGDEIAVDNENIAVEGVSVVAGNGQVTIMGAAGKNVTITNILGKVIANQTIASDNATIAVPAGIVAVAVEGEAAVKAIVK